MGFNTPICWGFYLLSLTGHLHSLVWCPSVRTRPNCSHKYFIVMIDPVTYHSEHRQSRADWTYTKVLSTKLFGCIAFQCVWWGLEVLQHSHVVVADVILIQPWSLLKLQILYVFCNLPRKVTTEIPKVNICISTYTYKHTQGCMHTLSMKEMMTAVCYRETVNVTGPIGQHFNEM